jgi:hypothetical protein
MADRTVATTDTFNDFRREVNGTARDIGDISDLLSASGFIASSTDLAEAIVAINTELPEIKTDAFIFPGRTMIFEGATDDSFETTISFTEPTADRTHTLPDNTGTIMLADTTDTSTNKTFTTPTITSGVFNTGVSGTAVLDEDAMGSDAANKLATQQSIKAYVDDSIDADMDLVFVTDSGNGQITMDSETLTLTGGTGIGSVGSGNTVTYSIDGTVSTLVGSDTFTNKTLTSPTLTSPVLNTSLSGTAFLDEDDMASDSNNKLASQQSIKAYLDNLLANQDLDFAPDSGTAQNIVLDSETMTISGGTSIGTSATGNTVTLAIANTVATLTGSQTLTNKTFTSPTINTMTFASGTTTSGLNIGSTGIVFEGATADAHETTLTAADPTQDNTITIPNATMTLLTTATHATKSNHIGKVIALG